MSHLHVNNDDVLADHNVALPTDVLDELVAARAGRRGRAEPHLGHGLPAPRSSRYGRAQTAPAIVDLLRADAVDGVVLAPV